VSTEKEENASISKQTSLIPPVSLNKICRRKPWNHEMYLSDLHDTRWPYPVKEIRYFPLNLWTASRDEPIITEKGSPAFDRTDQNGFSFLLISLYIQIREELTRSLESIRWPTQSNTIFLPSITIRRKHSVAYRRVSRSDTVLQGPPAKSSRKNWWGSSYFALSMRPPSIERMRVEKWMKMEVKLKSLSHFCYREPNLGLLRVRPGPATFICTSRHLQEHF